jgi:ferric-dicitrate binding protein FerR (iron transport regulator)
MPLDFDHMDDLIGKVLAGEATAEEQTQVHTWRQSQPDNEHYYQQLQSIFEKAAATPVQLQFDADAAWVRVKERLQQKSKVVPLRPARNYWQPLRIAAGVLLVAAAGLFAYQWFAQPVQTLQVASADTTLENVLPDSSTVFLNKKSSIAFEYNPREKTRKVKLQGEGFFDVKHEEEKPFVIQTDEVFVRDIGTAFNVRAYPDKDTVEVIVQSGEVQFYSLRDPGLYLKAGETGIYTKRGKVFTKIPRADTNALAYKTGIFSFHATDLRSVVDRINQVYGSRIRLADPLLGNCQITVMFANEPLETVVEIIAETMGLSAEHINNEIVLRGPGCQ